MYFIIHCSSASVARGTYIPDQSAMKAPTMAPKVSVPMQAMMGVASTEAALVLESSAVAEATTVTSEPPIVVTSAAPAAIPEVATVQTSPPWLDNNVKAPLAPAEKYN